jgi:hypothetical protein
MCPICGWNPQVAFHGLLRTSSQSRPSTAFCTSSRAIAFPALAGYQFVHVLCDVIKLLGITALQSFGSRPDSRESICRTNALR